VGGQRSKREVSLETRHANDTPPGVSSHITGSRQNLLWKTHLDRTCVYNPLLVSEALRNGVLSDDCFASTGVSRHQHTFSPLDGMDRNLLEWVEGERIHSCGFGGRDMLRNRNIRIAWGYGDLVADLASLFNTLTSIRGQISHLVPQL
jgi:hypothetical protein